MQQSDHPFTVQTVVQGAFDLQRTLKGASGGGHVTPDAKSESGTTIREALTALRFDIDTFLGEPRVGEARVGLDTVGGLDTAGGLG